jgi:hypothetical protein
MIELIIAGIFCVIIGVLVKMNLDLQEKVNQLEFDKIMRGINSDLETKGEDSFSQSIYKQRTIQ